MNYNLNIGKGLDYLNFDYSVNEIIHLLGKPKKITDDGSTLCMDYKNRGLFVSFEKEDEKWTDMDIQTDKIFYKNINWFDIEKSELLKAIKKIYQEKQITYKFYKSEVELLNEEQYDFYEIGVSLFFKINNLTNVYVSKPI